MICGWPFPSPLGDSILITRTPRRQSGCGCWFPSPLGDSILITRPLPTSCSPAPVVSVPSRGIILITGRMRKLREPVGCFRPLSGNPFSLHHLTTRSENSHMCFRPLSGNQFSLQRGGDQYAEAISVSVPSRGIHSHYMQYTVHHACGHEESCRPLSGIQFSLLTAPA